jgi:thymidine phosphorylase
VVCLAKPGDAVQAGQPVLELHAEDPALFDAAREALRDAIDVVDEAPVPQPLIVDRIEA